jgi:HD-GYP domain-containing protein (c-di-GMP phosphodiesterase class II)
MEDTAQREREASETRTLSKTVEEIFMRLSSIVRTAQIYEPNNVAFVQQIKPLILSIKDMLKSLGRAVFLFRGNTLFFNTIRVKVDFNSYQKFKFLANEFKEKEVEGVGFEPGLSEKELTRFIVLLAKSMAKKKMSFEDFKKEMKKEKIENIYIEKMQPMSEDDLMSEAQIRQSAKKVFFKSITHLKEVLAQEKQKHKPQVKTTRRLVQSIVNLLGHNESFMIGLTNIQNFEEYTLNHSTNVAILAICLGKRLGLEKKELLELGISAFFHDIGKLEIPRAILEKKGKLNDREKKLIEKHPQIGILKLVRLKSLSYFPVKALSVAMEHHIGVDLSGYPKYWKKTEPDLYSKIVKICDFFDALTTEREYREKDYSREEALGMMLDKTGTEFDPVLLQVFVKMVGVYPIGTLVALNTGELGIVAEINPEEAFVLRPKVKLISDEKEKRINGEIVDLIEKDPKDGLFKRTIVKTLDPKKYDINPADYFLAEATE